MGASFLDNLRYQDPLKGVGTVDPFNKVVWNDDLPSEIASPAYTFLFSGPPTYAVAQGKQELLNPIGLVQQAVYSPSRQVAPLPELGNRYFRHAPGRWSHQATIARVMSKSANLLGMLYGWARVLQPDLTFNINPFPGISAGSDPASIGVDRQIATVDTDLTDYPFGLYLVHLTENGDLVSAEYWERCLLVGYSKPIESSGVVIMETVQIVFGRPVAAAKLINMIGADVTIDLSGNTNTTPGATDLTGVFGGTAGSGT